MHFIFQFGEFTGDEGSFWSDLFVAVTGALIALFGAFFLYKRQIEDQKSKELSNLQNLQKDQLKYLHHLVNRAIRTTDVMVDELARFSALVSKKPTSKATLTLTVNSDLNRIVNRINQDTYFLAYQALIKDDKIGGILTYVDYLFETLEDIKLYYIDIHNRQHSERNEFLNMMQDLFGLVINNMYAYKNAEGDSGDHYLFFKFYFKKYSEFFSPDIDEIQIFNGKFLTPLLTDIHIKKNPPEYQQIFDIAEKASVLLSRIILNNESNGVNLKNYGNSLSNKVKTLKELIAPLHDFINDQH